MKALHILYFVFVFGCLSESLRGETILLHVKTALAVDDAQICVAPNVAMAALQSGDEVLLLFDGSAVTSITFGWGWLLFGRKTPMDNAALPERERSSLVEQLGITLSEIPSDYGGYLQYLEKRGVKIYVNRTMLTLYNIDPVDVDPVAQPVGLKEMMDLFKKADRILVY